MNYDVFNGDGDGIFALHQYRLAHPVRESTLITGVKRDIKLLDQLADCSNATVTVFDVSLDSNRESLLHLLKRDNSVTYFDHHFAGEIPVSPLLSSHINPSAEICTSLIVNDFLEGGHGSWAVCGAFGDNLFAPANVLANALGLSGKQTQQLQELGELFNYNGYGATVDDLHFPPETLYRSIQPFSNPFEYIDTSDTLETLRSGYGEDLANAMSQAEVGDKGKNRVYMFSDTPWARRVTGVFSNAKARERKDLAHAIITSNSDGTLRISVRAPLQDRRDADTLCKAFPTGGGRAAAAGINFLAPELLENFLQQFQDLYS